MKTSVEDLGPWQKAIAITLEPEEVEREMDRVVARYRAKAVMPGFRKGKVPNDLVRATFRDTLESDLLNQLLPEATRRAVDEHTLDLASPPEIRDLHFRPGEPLQFTAVVEIWPRVEVQGYKDLELDEVVNEVDDPMVEDFLGVLRERSAELRPVARPSEPGDIVDALLQAVDVKGQRLPRSKREEVKMEAGGDTLLPEFREASVGVEAGTSRVLTVHYPEEFRDPDLAGKQRHYHMKVRQILEKILPDLDDAFAGRIDGLETLDALRSKISLRLQAEERLRARQRTEEALIDRLIELNPFDVPPGIVERSLERAMEKAREEQQDLDEEDFRRVYTPLVVRMRKREILLDSIARAESIEVSEEDLDLEIGHSAPEGVDPRVIRKRLERDGELERIRHDLRERRIFDRMFESIKLNRVMQPRQRKSNLILP